MPHSAASKLGLHYLRMSRKWISSVRNCYTMVCLPLRGDNPRALASELSPVQADKYGITISYHPHQRRPCSIWNILCKLGYFWQGGFKRVNSYSYLSNFFQCHGKDISHDIILLPSWFHWSFRQHHKRIYTQEHKVWDLQSIKNHKTNINKRTLNQYTADYFCTYNILQFCTCNILQSSRKNKSINKIIIK